MKKELAQILTLGSVLGNMPSQRPESWGGDKIQSTITRKERRKRTAKHKQAKRNRAVNRVRQ